MAKISTYAIDGTPSLSDKVIGTEVANSSATKNYLLSDIFTLFQSQGGGGGYVPYTGATSNVVLGSFGITASSFIRTGGLSTQFLKADGSIDSNIYLTSSNAGLTYVPYTGATGNVNLGIHSLLTTDLTISGKVSANGGFGSSGQVLTSQGSSLPAVWQSPTAGAVSSILVATRKSTSNQIPSGLDVPLGISFGAFFSSPQLTIAPFGSISFIESGLYIVNVFMNLSVTTGAGVPMIMIRYTVNGIQIEETRAIFIEHNANVSTEYETTFVLQANVSDVLVFEIMRSSSGTDNGGLYAYSATGGWANIPSASIQIWKIV